MARPRYRTALVTGASSGLGRELALGLAAGGVRVFACARRAALLDELVAAIGAAGGTAEACPLDVADGERTAATLRRIDERSGGLDLVVANAAVGAPRDVAPYAWEAVRAALHVNLCGAAATLTGALPAMVARGRGHLVGISSLASFGALPAAAAYSAPKAGLSMLLACLRLDVVPLGIDVTTVHAGFIATPMTARSTHRMPQRWSAAHAARHVLARLPSAPAEIAFPEPLASATRWLARLPRPVRERLLRRLG
ncbi:MAG: SDR family NAD(P)-dependent oxidoreductase [Polyangiaceae bacterium]|nr:SDR family NAD(P)-dependent oxidoreductase [Polyangiaceae bacterium]